MSWDSYITTLTAHCMIDHAAICGKKLGEESLWATSPGFTMTVEEIKRLAGDSNILRCCGPTVGGVKCMFLRDNSEDPSLYCMDLKSVKDEQGNTRCVCVGVTHTALVIAMGSIGANAGTVAQEVYKTVTYLRENNI